MALESFANKIASPLKSFMPDTLQVNLGKLCNQACLHCHVDAGPKRTEIMDKQTVVQVLDAIPSLKVSTVDLTGGAPEMNPHFRFLVENCRSQGVKRIIDRCNLTILLEPNFDWAAEFLAQNGVEVTASLPFYVEENVDRQRGRGVFRKSIDALRLLNAHGYGKELTLNLVYNPQGAYLPPDQDELRDIYQRFLGDEYGICFNNLFTITNMPISRFAHYLVQSGNFDGYMNKLVRRYNPATLSSVMCRSLISVGYDGTLYDCDFNQMLDMPVAGEIRHIGDISKMLLEGRSVQVANHCYGCTAGGGSSCGGSLGNNDEADSISV